MSLVVGDKDNKKCSIDRIDNSKGYFPDNIQLVTWEANLKKNDMTSNEYDRMSYYLYWATASTLILNTGEKNISNLQNTFKKVLLQAENVDLRTLSDGQLTKIEIIMSQLEETLAQSY
jgi:hypothetical protein